MTTVFFATNRNPRPTNKPTNYGKRFNDGGAGTLRFGDASVDGNRVNVRTYPEKLVPGEGNLSMDLVSSKLGSSRLFSDLRKQMAENQRDTILFVHGYNVGFKSAVKAAAKIADNFAHINNGDGVNVALFSWPSDGAMKPWLSYSSDRQDAAGSGPALARGLLKLRDFIVALGRDADCGRQIHLIAHSMGNYVLRHALQEVRRHTPRALPRVFDQILLMAPDEDADAFEHEHKLFHLPGLCRRVTVYFNRNDRAMAISDMTKGNPDRLGDDGLQSAYRGPTGKLTQVDCTGVVTGVVEHSYYVDCERVVSDMCDVLEGRSPDTVGGRHWVQDRQRFVLY